jgi:hypothetical protein
MLENADRVSQEKSVLLKDNSLFMPHNQTYQRVDSDSNVFLQQSRNVTGFGKEFVAERSERMLDDRFA